MSMVLGESAPRVNKVSKDIGELIPMIIRMAFDVYSSKTPRLSYGAPNSPDCVYKGNVCIAPLQGLDRLDSVLAICNKEELRLGPK